MSDQSITVSNGDDFFRIPLSDLEEACADGFYVPALNNRTIVSDGADLFEIPLADLPEAQADGFCDLMLAERDVIEDALAILSPPDSASDSTFHFDDLPEPEASVAAETIASGDTMVAVAAPQTVAQQSETPTTASATPKAADVDDADLPEAEAEEGDGSVMSKLLLTGGTIGGGNTWQVMAMNAGLHGLIFLLLAMIILPTPEFDVFMEITSAIEPKDPVEMDFEAVELEQPVELDSDTSETEVPNQFDVESPEMVEMDISDVELSIPDQPVLSDAATGPPTNNSKSEMGGRSKAGRAAMVAKRGGTAASETAVNQSLSWMARHQYPDGGWSFNHALGQCKGECGDPGELAADCRNAATGMALLAMLGAGHTPFEGDFQPEVQRGIAFLLNNAKPAGAGLDLRGQFSTNTGMYTQAIATTALCEMVAMIQHEFFAGKGDKEQLKKNVQRKQILAQLYPAAQAGVAFIVKAQHSPTGGWGYNPGQEGDTSILGWQMMALKSAAHAKIPVSRSTVGKANLFLNSVQSKDGGYGYRDPNKKYSTTAIGIISRMLSGMSLQNEQLQLGIDYLSAHGPEKNNMYYNYYATQVMLHAGGAKWKKWNDVMREQLVNTQIKEGHAAGSWNLADAHGKKAGRLYMTCLCTMTLEVYYRHLPLYGEPEEDEINDGKEVNDLTKMKK